MTVLETPANEAGRLLALRSLEILDTPPEERFDRITRMARRIFGVPIALVSLVDESRQWFKSCDGLSIREADRKGSFCSQAILQRNTYIIEDAKTDPNFQNNPFVVGEPYIRFYAGHPLRAPNGEALGTLCVMDSEPRQLTREDIEMLTDLASIVERELIAIQLSLIDEMTRISNRRGFFLLSKYSLEICRRQLLPASLVFLDLNKFKHINDTYGHKEGDKVLILFADKMRQSFRSSDIFARLGGDEFVVLLTNIKPDEVQDLIQRFKHSLIESTIQLGLTYNVDFSFGIAAFDPVKHANIDALIEEADQAMYLNKTLNGSSGITK